MPFNKLTKLNLETDILHFYVARTYHLRGISIINKESEALPFQESISLVSPFYLGSEGPFEQPVCAPHPPYHNT
jgi:hypothetical protein